MSKQKVFIGISGGVDSAVSGYLLKKAGYDCHAVYMVMHEAGEEGIDAAKEVAHNLEIPFHLLDCKTEFENVISYFCKEYKFARTPNPCVFCNRFIKFGLFWDFCSSQGADKVATGHYARILEHNGQNCLAMSTNKAKDQSYVLSMINPKMLERIILPLGEMVKEDVRNIATEIGLEVANKPDSQEICFIPDDDYAGMIEQNYPEIIKPGKIIDPDGNILGDHAGIHKYTIGQRRGLGIALGKPAYVVNIEADNGSVTLGDKEQLMSKTLTATDINWLTNIKEKQFKAHVKIRYNHSGSPATVNVLPGKVEIEFDEPVSAVTPGQAAVIYIDNGEFTQVAGGGWIIKS